MTPRAGVILAYASMCAIWGTTWLGIKVGLQYLPPLSGAGARFVVAGLLLYALAKIQGRILPARATPWKLIAVLAVFLFGVNYILTYTAETHLSSGLVAVLFGVLPFFTFTFAHSLLAERTTPRTWIGALLAFGGVAVISLVGDVRGSFLYALAAIAAAASSAFANVYAKRHSSHAPIVILPPAMLAAGCVMTLAGVLLEHPSVTAALSPPSIGAVLYLAVFGSGVAFFLNMWLLQRIGAWVVGMSALIIPVIAVIVGILFGGETFGIRDLIGAALVIAGVWVALAV